MTFGRAIIIERDIMERSKGILLKMKQRIKSNKFTKSKRENFKIAIAILKINIAPA